MKKKITNTMIRLLDQYSYSEITVTMICRHVPVSRTAFYRYFHDKEDILFYYVAEEYTEKCLPIFRFHLKEISTLCFFSYVLESKETYAKLYQIDEGVFLFRALKAAYHIGFERRKEYSVPAAHKKGNFDPRVLDEYATSGIAAVIVRWIKNDMRVPAEKMAGDLYIMMSEPLPVVRDTYV